MEIMRESAAKNFSPLFRGTVPLMGHSLASAILGLVGQPRLQKYIQDELGSTGMLGKSATNLVASAVVRAAPPCCPHPSSSATLSLSWPPPSASGWVSVT